jgi:hypothetical protein
VGTESQDSLGGTTTALIFGGLFLAVLLLIGLMAYRYWVAKSNADKLGVPEDESTFLAWTDPETTGAAMMTGVNAVDAAREKAQQSNKTITQRIAELDEALAANLITQAEHDQSKQRLLDEL